jgi:hypothetical protein
MARSITDARRLPANIRAIKRGVNAPIGPAGKVIEYRIDGARGLVLHVLPSGTVTWYFHYDVLVGRRRRRRKFKIGRLDEVSLAQAIAQAETLRPQASCTKIPRPASATGTTTSPGMWSCPVSSSGSCGRRWTMGPRSHPRPWRRSSVSRY